MYSVKDILAVIVSFNPDETINKNIEALQSQTSKIIVYDNNSQEKSLNILKALQKEENIELIINNENLGIPARLNEALKYARNRNFSLLLTMDQDTVLQPDCVQQMIDVLNKNDHIVSVGPNRKGCVNKDGYVLTDYLITSGNLLVVEKIYDKHPFWEKLFIDLVDIETSLYIRLLGYNLAIATNAFMKHKVGEFEENRLLCYRHVYLSHSAKRFEYKCRNSVIVLRLYWKKYKLFCIKLSFFLLLDCLKIFLEKNWIKKIHCAVNGFLHGLKTSIEERKKEIYANN